jgi:hypothetical protein
VKNIDIFQNLYLNDKYSLKKYHNDYYRLIYHKTPIRQAGFELASDKVISRNVNDEKLDNNLSRAKSKVFEYALCNHFDYFMTLTLDPNKYNRYDLSTFIKDLGQFIRDLRKKYDIDIQYLLIPEPHKDGAWHMHGLIKGMPEEQLRLFTLEEKLPYKVLNLIKKGNLIYDWTNYTKKFGWCTVEKVKNQEAVSKYITKYITKALKADLTREKEKKLYYVTRGLKTAEKIKEGTLTSHQLARIPFDYQNDYIKILNFDNSKYLEVLEFISTL